MGHTQSTELAGVIDGLVSITCQLLSDSFKWFNGGFNTETLEEKYLPSIRNLIGHLEKFGNLTVNVNDTDNLTAVASKLAQCIESLVKSTNEDSTDIIDKTQEEKFDGVVADLNNFRGEDIMKLQHDLREISSMVSRCSENSQHLLSSMAEPSEELKLLKEENLNLKNQISMTRTQRTKSNKKKVNSYIIFVTNIIHLSL